MSATLSHRDAVLNAWLSGRRMDVIGAEFGISTAQVNNIVAYARSRGDTRAVVRNPVRRPASNSFRRTCLNLECCAAFTAPTRFLRLCPSCRRGG